MNFDMPPVLTTQISALAAAMLALLIGFARGKASGSLIFIAFMGASTYGWFTFADLLRNLYQESAIFERMVLGTAQSFPRLITTWVELASWVSLVVGALVAWTLLIIMILMTGSEKIIRGAKLMPREKMIKAIKRKGVSKVPISIGGYAIPTELEMRCFLLCGEPGTGKTQLILKMILSILRRGDSYACVDINGDIYRRLGRVNDIVLSPVHVNGIDTSPFADIKVKTDCRLIANSLIAEGVGESKAWFESARGVMTVIFEKCLERGKTTNRDLIYYASYASREELRELVKGTTAHRVFDSSNEKKIDDVLGIVSEAIKSLELLNPDADHKSFSVRNWMSSDHKKGNLWIIYDDATAASTSILRGMWINLMIAEGFSLVPSTKRRIWMFLDELSSNGRIGGLSQAVSKLRKYGVNLTLAFQNINQLYSIYGADETKSIIGSVGHSVILRTPDADTAEYLSRSIGDGEILAESKTHSGKGSVSTTTKIESRRAVLASEIMQLDDLRGYIKIAGIGWSRLRVPLIDLPVVNRLQRSQLAPLSKIKNKLDADLDEI
ncbi:type IV secretion system DNA-binding domain-containing protein [Cellvibrio sp. KY-YJ-3]|uniref:type IV secretion system DNA-binding domain-containing protein n=1 Tax=Cellvibrio sp. KY-YJ-3 TaxID=454662 RepID=UPI001247C58B|nr:type IV secretion system DNA-binding domain-containing protein [Cellvibrio sp. KY-YJ-3]QEY13285.1 hypothetical protein D0B88_14145 [Cellvibrio sp. KY-YJ-3]